MKNSTAGDDAEFFPFHRRFQLLQAATYGFVGGSLIGFTLLLTIFPAGAAVAAFCVCVDEAEYGRIAAIGFLASIPLTIVVGLMRAHRLGVWLGCDALVVVSAFPLPEVRIPFENITAVTEETSEFLGCTLRLSVRARRRWPSSVIFVVNHAELKHKLTQRVFGALRYR